MLSFDTSTVKGGNERKIDIVHMSKDKNFMFCFRKINIALTSKIASRGRAR